MTYDDCIDLYTSKYSDYCAQNSTDGAGLIDNTGGNPAVEVSSSPMDTIGSFFEGIFSNWLLIVLLVIAVILVIISGTIVRQQEVGVVERLGRYHRSLPAGLHFIVPFIDQVAHVVNLEQFLIKVNSEVKTKGDQIVILPVVATLKVIPTAASTSVYEVEDPKEAITALISNEVKATAATMTLDAIYEDRGSITTAILEALGETITTYGFEVRQVVIDNPDVGDELKIAYNSVAVAEKGKQAATAEGEALRIKLVAEAEAKGAALEIAGEAYIKNRAKIAKGNSEALKEMTGDTGLTAVQALNLLVAIDSNNAVRDAAGNKGTTVVVATGNQIDQTLGMLASSNASSNG